MVKKFIVSSEELFKISMQAGGIFSHNTIVYSLAGASAFSRVNSLTGHCLGLLHAKRDVGY